MRIYKTNGRVAPPHFAAFRQLAAWGRIPMDTVDNIDKAKAVLRTASLGRRQRLRGREGAASRQVLDNFIAAIDMPPAAAVSGFLPINGEIDVRPLLAALGARGHSVALPVVLARRQPLAFREWADGAPLEDGPFGTRHPGGDAATIAPDVLLVPLLAFDRSGGRLGYGGGYYDRTLAALRRTKPVLAVGVAYGEQEVPDVPCDSDDQPLDWVVTDREAIVTGVRS